MRKRVFLAVLLNFLGGMAFGVFLAACFIFEDSEIRAHTVRFWVTIFGG